MKVQLALFASGSGTNVENIIRYFKAHKYIEVSLVLSNNMRAKVIEKASKHGVQTIIFDRKSFYESEKVSELLKDKKIDWIVLAGFLWKFPEKILSQYPNKVLNIHPALLPKFGGKGMYGMNIHRAVAASGEKETGITVHFVNENYDEGKIIFQKKTTLKPNDSAEVIAEKIHQLEQKFFPQVIENTILHKRSID